MSTSGSQQHRVSAVIPVYNGERYLAAALDSVMEQDYPELEVVVIDDGSTDRSGDIARSYARGQPHPLRYHRQDNAGLSAAQNAGVRESRGEFIGFLDCDDLWTPGKISRQMSIFAEQPDIDMVFGRVEEFISPEILEFGDAPDLEARGIMPGYSTGTLLARRRAFERTGPFSPAFRLGEFLDWYARACDAGLNSIMVDDILLRRRIHRDNMGRRERDKRADYLRVFKATLDRRRQPPGGGAL